MPIDPSRESWKPGMPWERAVEDMDYIRGLAKEMGGGRTHRATAQRRAIHHPRAD